MFACVTGSNVYIKRHKTSSMQHNPEKGKYARFALSKSRHKTVLISQHVIGLGLTMCPMK